MAWTNNVEYKNVSERFMITPNDRKGAYKRQYCEMYEARINEMKDRILENADKIYGKNKYKFIALSDVEPNEEVLIIGIIIKRMSGRPSILKSLLNEDKVAYDDYETNDENEDIQRYIGSSEDQLELESDRQTIKLEGQISMNECATGCCVGVFGKLGEEGVFNVEKLIWPSVKIENPVKSVKSTIAVISGMELTGNFAEDRGTISSFELMAQWLKGEVDSSNEEAEKIALVDRLVILGPSIETKMHGCDVQSVVRTLTLTKHEKHTSSKSLTVLDKLITSLTDKIHVDLVSGIGDPCSSMWPQQPIHRVCLPRVGMSEQKVNLVTNPYEFELGKMRISASSGENVTNLLKTSYEWTGCDVLENIIKWQHLAPSCPDSLDGFPMTDRDALIMTTTPKILIAGNQARAEIRNVKVDGTSETCLTICVPKFSKYRAVCLINLEDLTTSWRVFDHDF